MTKSTASIEKLSKVPSVKYTVCKLPVLTIFKTEFLEKVIFSPLLFSTVTII